MEPKYLLGEDFRSLLDLVNLSEVARTAGIDMGRLHRATREGRPLKQSEIQTIILLIGKRLLEALSEMETLGPLPPTEHTPAFVETLALFDDGYSYKEISRQLGIALGTVKSRISRARRYMGVTRDKEVAL